ncbi:MAG: SCP2 sterol-binding domain-containing protein [Acidimicrobiales bacterium]|nr:SCP2 sterol-binding domain-containing protein [Acidimicrobiales bacterium]
MAEFLSAEWLADLDAAARATPTPADLQVVVQQIVALPDGGEVAYEIRIAHGSMRVLPGRSPDADVTFTQDRVTAEAVATGQQSAQAAFIDGRLRVGGDLRSVIGLAGDISGLGDPFGPARPAASEIEGPHA